MSLTRVTTCDVCAAAAGPDHSWMFPDHGWLAINARHEMFDVCSVECFELLAARFVGKAEVVALTRLYEQPAARKPRPRKPNGGQ